LVRSAHWYDSKINNGILEGLNSLVQATKAKAHGYRTFKNLKTIIYMLIPFLNQSAIFVGIVVGFLNPPKADQRRLLLAASISSLI
jgi:hypothetical protein